MSEKTWYGLWPVKRRLLLPFFYRYELLLAFQKHISEYLPEPGPAAAVSEEILREVLAAEPSRAPTDLEAYRWFFAVVSLFDRSYHGSDISTVLRLECLLLRCVAVMEEKLFWYYGTMGQRERRLHGMQRKHNTAEREQATILVAQNVLRERKRTITHRELARQVSEKMAATYEKGTGPKPYATTRMLQIFRQHLPPATLITDL